jgi:asparagine synthase (glutamine-hydrolysing)
MAFAPSWRDSTRVGQKVSWLDRAFLHRNAGTFGGERLKLLGCRPSLQEGALALEGLQRQISATERSSDHPFEKTYPLLDRDLVEFLFAIPRNQLVRPGERRSLMRRTLEGIVPDQVLKRRRKAYVSRSPILRIKAQYQALTKGDELLLDSLGVIDRARFFASIEEISSGKPGHVVPVLRALLLERWLRELRSLGALSGRTISHPAPPYSKMSTLADTYELATVKGITMI